MKKHLLPNEEKHSHCVMVRFNDFEYGLISERAAEAHMSVASYVRQQAVYHDISRSYPITFESEDLKKIVHEIGKIGTNLNQIAKHFNYGGDRSLEMTDAIHGCIAELHDMRKEVLALGGTQYGNHKTSLK